MLPERIAVDATALISASIRGAALEIFLKATIREFLTTGFTFQEAVNVLPAICKKRSYLPLFDVELILHTLPVVIYDRDHYMAKIEESKSRIGKVDKNDVDLLSLALYEDIPIWSEDSHFRVPQVREKTKVYKTSDLLKVLRAHR